MADFSWSLHFTQGLLFGLQKSIYFSFSLLDLQQNACIRSQNMYLKLVGHFLEMATLSHLVNDSPTENIW